MLVCIKITITAKIKIPLLCFIEFQKAHCTGLAGCGMRVTIKAGYGIRDKNISTGAEFAQLDRRMRDSFKIDNGNYLLLTL